ncbi:MAG: hypothetical protein ACJ0DI_00365 [bacterium]
MSLQELGIVNVPPSKRTPFHFNEELEMKIVVILHKGYTCPKLQNSMPGKAEKYLLLGEKIPFRVDEESWKILIPGPHPPSATVPPLPEGVGSWFDHGFCDSALRLRAE